MVKGPDKETIVSATDTISPLSEKGFSLQQQEAGPVGKRSRGLIFAPPGETGADPKVLQRAQVTERITVLKKMPQT